MECRGKEEIFNRTREICHHICEARTLSAGTVLAAKPEDLSAAPQHLLPIFENGRPNEDFYIQKSSLDLPFSNMVKDVKTERSIRGSSKAEHLCLSISLVELFGA